MPMPGPNAEIMQKIAELMMYNEQPGYRSNRFIPEGWDAKRAIPQGQEMTGDVLAQLLNPGVNPYPAGQLDLPPDMLPYYMTPYTTNDRGAVVHGTQDEALQEIMQRAMKDYGLPPDYLEPPPMIQEGPSDEEQGHGNE